MQYTIIPILSKEDLETNSAWVTEFFHLYCSEACFPDENEREVPEDILDRISKRPHTLTELDIEANLPDPFTHLLCLKVTEDRHETLAGGCIIEFYPDSQSLLITYLFVHPDYRKAVRMQGEPDSPAPVSLAEVLLKDKAQGLPWLITKVEQDYRKKVRAVFFESNNPARTAFDSMPPHKRLNFFRKLAAKRVDFNYIQPPLDAESEPVDNLYLLVYPYPNTSIKFIRITTVMSFLLEFTKSLTNKTPERSLYTPTQYQQDRTELQQFATEVKKHETLYGGVDLRAIGSRFARSFMRYKITDRGVERFPLQEMFKSLLANAYPGRDCLYLSEIPRTEEPKFRFSRATITVQVLVDEDYFQPSSLKLTPNNGHWVKNTQHHVREEGNPAFGTWQKLRRRFRKKHDTEETLALWAAEQQRASQKAESLYCAVCHSYETDLFSYQYQVTPPYHTKVFEQEVPVILRIPERIEYISEGRIETYLFNREWKKENAFWVPTTTDTGDGFRYIALRLYLSYTFFERSNIRIWNFSFSPRENETLDEFTIIKLAKFFTGTPESRSQEDKAHTILDHMQFAIQNKGTGLPDEAIKQLPYKNLVDAFFNEDHHHGLGIAYHITEEGLRRCALAAEYIHTDPYRASLYDTKISYKNIKTGVTHLDMSVPFMQETGAHAEVTGAMRKMFRELFHKIKNLEENKEDANEENPWEVEIANMLCGTTLGIFDYDRMGPEEIEDTLSPRTASVSETSFLTINRGALTAYHIAKDQVLDAAWNSLGASPYLLLPSALLAQNEYVTLDAENQLDELIRNLKGQGLESIDISEIIRRRNQIDELLNNNYLPNVYNYKTERDLYDYGSSHRGISQRYQLAKYKLAQLDIMIEQSENSRSNKYQKIVQFVLGLISMITLLTFIKDLIISDNEVVIKTVIFGLIIIAALATLIFFLLFHHTRSVLGTGNYVEKDKPNHKKRPKT